MSSAPPHRYEPIVIGSESTVVSEFVPDAITESHYQSEAELERAFIKLLEQQAYERLTFHTEAELIANLRHQLERLNDFQFTESEWERFFSECIAGEKDSVTDKTARIQEDHIQLLRCDDGTVKNVRLIDKKNIHNNRLQVINQYEIQGSRKNRYDVTVLVNGLPMVHIELKRRGVAIREAFNQIDRYRRDSFWAGSGLFDYVQIFAISNGTHTKYYSNTTREQHLEETKAPSRRPRRTSDSFEFTSWWADANNKPIQDLTGFAKTFFAKHTLLNILTKYCVFAHDRVLLVMRPYQIAATELMLRRIEISTNLRKLGTVEAGGYVWHTTGSGKTLTSFKAAQLASQLPQIDKVVFVVDRRDLDYQTMKEYDRFQKGAANSNTSTKVLKQQLENPDARIIVTTIQKLSRFIADNKGHEIYDGHMVIVFDECHRSQFGEMHTAITKAFKRYHLFGFTGTPIFPENAAGGGNPNLKTTQQAFGDRLHTYTIVDAINDKNVLPFRIDYINTVKLPPEIADKAVSAIDTENALLAPERIGQVVSYILEHFDQKTRRSFSYSLDDKRLRGFNSLFATASIKAARLYYEEFKRQQQELPPAQRLKVGLIYSYAANEEAPAGLLDDEAFDTGSLSADDRTFLESAISDYNQMFTTNFSTSSDGFENYYKDISERMRNREIDLVIVVNMFLTGFDSKTLNTLWVDKNVRSHGLLQAFSRTNRILNSVKTYGNIITFRDLEQATNDAIALFGDKEAGGIVLLKPFAGYYAEYKKLVAELVANFPLGAPFIGESSQKEFITLFGKILRLQNILVAFDDFEGNEILTPRQTQDYQSVYLDLYAELRKGQDADKESIIEDLEFEIELIKQVEINVDYILMLVENYRKSSDDKAKEIRAEIRRAVDASPTLRSKRDLIEAFVESITVDADIDVQWQEFIAARRAAELEQIITDENLNPDAAYGYIETAFRNGSLQTGGTAIAKALPPITRFSSHAQHAQKKSAVLERFAAFFERYLGLTEPPTRTDLERRSS